MRAQEGQSCQHIGSRDRVAAEGDMVMKKLISGKLSGDQMSLGRVGGNPALRKIKQREPSRGMAEHLLIDSVVRRVLGLIMTVTIIEF